MIVRELTLAMACRLALRLDATHRAEILRGYPSLTAWATSRMERGIAWSFVIDAEPVCAIGIFSVGNGRAGCLWLAGARGWTRHVRKIAPFWKGVLTSRAYETYVCDTFVDNVAEARWVAHLGFKEFGRGGDRIYHAVVP